MLALRSSDIAIDLKRLKFGKATAEQDKLLESDFIINAALESVIFGSANLITGQKGSGKSAIFKIVSNLSRFTATSRDAKTDEMVRDLAHLRTKFQESEGLDLDDYINELNDKCIVELNETHNLEAYKFLVAQKSLDEPAKFRLLWLIYIAVLIGQYIVKESQYRVIGTSYIEKLKKLISPFNINSESSNDLSETVIAALKNLKLKVSVLWKGMSVEMSHQDTPSTTDNNVELNLYDLLKHEQFILDTWDIDSYVLIDRLDDFYKYDKPKMKHFIQGLFLAVEELRYLERINTVIFIRSDIFASTDVNDMDKFRDSKIKITWDTEETFRFLGKRLLFNPQIRDLIGSSKVDKHTIDLLMKIIFPAYIEHLDVNKKVVKVPFKKWFTLHLQNASGFISPRDLLVFISKCIHCEIQRNPKGIATSTPLISSSSINKSYREISEEKFDDIIKLSGYADLLAFLKSVNYLSFSFKKLKNILSDSERPDIELMRELKVLESLGFLSINSVKANRDSFTYRFNIAPLFCATWNGNYVTES